MGGPGYPGYGPAPSAWPGGRGPIGRTTSPGIQILLTIVTLGIWGLVWTYRQYRDMHNDTGTGISGGVGLLISILPIGNIVTYFLLPSEVEGMYERDGQPSPVSAVYGLFAFIPVVGTLIWYIIVQRAINQFWVARGAPPP
jgi:Zn-dependent protease